MDDTQDTPRCDLRGGEPRELQNPDVIEAIGSAVRAHGIKDVARRLRKSAGQLYAELSEFGDQRRAKLSLDDAIEATHLTRDATWLEMTAARLGYHLVPIGVASDKASVHEELCDDMTDLGQFTAVCQDPEATEKDIRRAANALRRNVLETEELAVVVHRRGKRS